VQLIQPFIKKKKGSMQLSLIHIRENKDIF